MFCPDKKICKYSSSIFLDSSISNLDLPPMSYDNVSNDTELVLVNIRNVISDAFLEIERLRYLNCDLYGSIISD